MRAGRLPPGVSPAFVDGESEYPDFEDQAAGRLALEQGERGHKYLAIAEESIPLHKIARAVGERLKLPVKSISPDEAESHFGWFARISSETLSASGEYLTQKFGWQPNGRCG